MRVAPSIQIECAAGGAWVALQQALYGLAVAVGVAWATGLAGADGGRLAAVGLIAGLVAGLATALLAGRALCPPGSSLRWDSGRWSLQQAGGTPVAGRAEVKLDLGPWMLLRFRPEGGGARHDRWLALSQRQSGPGWHGARVALFAPQPQAAEPARAGRAWPTA